MLGRRRVPRSRSDRGAALWRRPVRTWLLPLLWALRLTSEYARVWPWCRLHPRRAVLHSDHRDWELQPPQGARRPLCRETLPAFRSDPSRSDATTWAGLHPPVGSNPERATRASNAARRPSWRRARRRLARSRRSTAMPQTRWPARPAAPAPSLLGRPERTKGPEPDPCPVPTMTRVVPRQC